MNSKRARIIAIPCNGDITNKLEKNRTMKEIKTIETLGPLATKKYWTTAMNEPPYLSE